MNTSVANTTVFFHIDFINKKIIGTKASFNKAGKGIGKEYEELARKVAAHPDFELEVKVPKHKSNKAKQTYDGLNFAFIEAYINTLENAADILNEYNKVKKFADDSKLKVYPMVKKWFLQKFSSEENPFDMAAAKEAISNHNLDRAVSSVAANEEARSEEIAENNLYAKAAA